MPLASEPGRQMGPTCSLVKFATRSQKRIKTPQRNTEKLYIQCRICIYIFIYTSIYSYIMLYIYVDWTQVYWLRCLQWYTFYPCMIYDENNHDQSIPPTKNSPKFVPHFCVHPFHHMNGWDEKNKKKSSVTLHPKWKIPWSLHTYGDIRLLLPVYCHYIHIILHYRCICPPVIKDG